MGAYTSAGCVVLEIGRDDGLDIASKARGKRKVGEKKKRRKKNRKNKNHVCIMAAPKGNGFAANVNDPMAAGGMAATDVTQASEQAKTREFLTKHRFKDPEDGCNVINMEKVVQKRAEERASEEVDPKSKPKEKTYQAWTGAGNGPLAAPLVNKINQLIETLCLNLHKYMKRPADGEKTELEKSADPDTRTEALLVEFCKGVANEGMPELLDTDEEQQDAIDEPLWQRSLAPEEQEAHGMMNDEGNGDKKAVPMVLKNIQFKGSQLRTAAEAAKKLEEALRRGADAVGIKTK